jgi:hypothetical protein
LPVVIVDSDCSGLSLVVVVDSEWSDYFRFLLAAVNFDFLDCIEWTMAITETKKEKINFYIEVL